MTEAPPARGADVLIVDDDEDIRLALSAAFADAGITHATAENGAAALAWLACHPAPRVILLDVLMPVMDGPTFRERQLADASLRDVPIVVLTAGRKRDALPELAATAVMEKPFDLAQLFDTLAALVSDGAR